MNSYQKASVIGDKGEAFAKMLLESVYVKVRDVPREINTQMEWADIVAQGCPLIGIKHKKYEIKTESKYTGNLFLEHCSNRKSGRLGWMFTSKADSLLYLFWDDGIGFYIEDFQAFKTLFNHFQLQFPEVRQNKYDQTNDTWGRLVPVDADFVKKYAHRFCFEKDKIKFEKTYQSN